MSIREIKTIGNYTLGKTIGEGTFGLVKLGIHQLTQEQVAIKILEKDKIKEQADLERVAREINILKQLRHPNIIQLYEIVETERSLYLIMEYAKGGELFDHISKHQRLKEFEAAQLLIQILAGVEYLHSQRIMHRDLKPENLLLDENSQLKIADFGLSNTYNQDQLLKTACGSPCYAAPEMIAGKEYSGRQADIWSCGVILYAMICGYLPFEDQSTPALYKKIVNGEYAVPKYMSPLAKDLLDKILNVDPIKRFSIPQIMQHFWIQSNVSNPSLLDGIIIGRDEIQIEEEVLHQLQEYNFKIEYAQQCILRNRHNQVTTTYYLLLKKYQIHKRNKHHKDDSRISTNYNTKKDMNVNTNTNTNTNANAIVATNNNTSNSNINNLVEKTSELKIISESDISVAKQTEIITDDTTQNVIRESNKIVEQDNSSEISEFHQEHIILQDINTKENVSSSRQSYVENSREAPQKDKRVLSKLRQASMSIEKKPETLFPTIQQIREKAQQFKTRALERYEKSPQPQKQVLRNTPINTQAKRSAVSPHIAVKQYEGPFNVNQLVYGDPAAFNRKICNFLQSHEYEILNQRKYDFRIRKDDLAMEYQIQQLIEGVYVIKCKHLEGNSEEYEGIFNSIVSIK